MIGERAFMLRYVYIARPFYAEEATLHHKSTIPYYIIMYWDITGESL